MNPETNKFEKLYESADSNESGDVFLSALERQKQLLRPDGTQVPKNWTLFSEGEHVNVKDYTFKVAHIGETYFVLEPVGPIIIEEVK